MNIPLVWKPHENINLKYSLEELVDDQACLITYLSDASNPDLLLELTLDFYSVFHQITTRTSSSHLESHSYIGNKYLEWSFFIIKDSYLCTKLSEGSMNIYRASKLTHYVIITQSSIIDLISTYDPVVDIIPKHQQKRILIDYPEDQELASLVEKYHILYHACTAIDRYNTGLLSLDHLQELLDFRLNERESVGQAWQKKMNASLEALESNHNQSQQSIAAPLLSVSNLIKEKMLEIEPLIKDTNYFNQTS